MLWTAGRHHIGEIKVTHVWDCLEIEVSQSLDISIFLRFRSIYGSLSTSHIDNLKFPKIDFTDLISETKVQALLEKAKCSERVRDDYNELISITQLFITKNTSNFMLMKPGDSTKLDG